MGLQYYKVMVRGGSNYGVCIAENIPEIGEIRSVSNVLDHTDPNFKCYELEVEEIVAAQPYGYSIHMDHIENLVRHANGTGTNGHYKMKIVAYNNGKFQASIVDRNEAVINYPLNWFKPVCEYGDTASNAVANLDSAIEQHFTLN